MFAGHDRRGVTKTIHDSSRSSRARPAPIVLGDARLTLTKSDQTFDLIMLDAFTSDAIPVHLITREAIRGYLARLRPNGVIVMNISNRHMELSEVVQALGASENLVAIAKLDDKAHDFAVDYRSNAHVALLARDAAHFGRLPQQGWQMLAPANVAPWTDDYSDIISAILRKKLQY